MRINDNGIYRDLTQKELLELEKNTHQAQNSPLSLIERITTLESQNRTIQKDNEDLWLLMAELELGGSSV